MEYDEFGALRLVPPARQSSAALNVRVRAVLDALQLPLDGAQVHTLGLPDLVHQRVQRLLWCRSSLTDPETTTSPWAAARRCGCPPSGGWPGASCALRMRIYSGGASSGQLRRGAGTPSDWLG